MFVSNLPPDASEESVRELFSEFGIVRSISISSDIFTGKCRGFGTVAMEGHEARAAMARLDGKTLGDKSLRVRYEDPKAKSRRRR
ncbi:MAG: RNA-binding protein [Gammaproteobacteria bacterium]